MVGSPVPGTETVTAPQALWLMNNPLAQASAEAFGERLRGAARGDRVQAIELGYRLALCRRAEPHEIQICLDYMREHDSPFEGLAWMLFNLDAFVYVR